MEIRQVFYNHFSHKEFFELSEGARPWNVFLLVAKGGFRCRIGAQEYEIGENEIAYFPMNTHFSRQIISPIEMHHFGFYADPAHPYYTQLSPGKLQIPHSHVRTILEELDIISKMPDNQPLLLHTIEHIMIENFIGSSGINKSWPIFPKDILAVIQYMSEHLSEKIDMDQLAASVHLSHVGLLWKFKQYTGSTLSDYLIRLRMQYAKQLLLEGDLRINEVAAQCGYSSPYYFSNAFRKIYQMSPTAFRTKHLNG